MPFFIVLFSADEIESQQPYTFSVVRVATPALVNM